MYGFREKYFISDPYCESAFVRNIWLAIIISTITLMPSYSSNYSNGFLSMFSIADNAEDKFSHKEKKLSGLSNRSGKELKPSINSTTNQIIRDMVDAAKKVFENDGSENEREELTSVEALEKMANDLFYRFNYTITSHSHWEDGFHGGRKDGEFNAKFKDGVDTNVKYISNEFGYQPNITLVPRQEIIYSNNDNNNTSDENNDNDNITTTTQGPPYRGHYFNWFKK